jgi:ketosteroid isomerase-like protein
VENDRPDSKPEPLESDAPNPDSEELLTRINHDFRWPKPSDEAVAAALQAIQRLGVEAALGVEGPEMGARDGDACPKCGAVNLTGNRFCGYCGTLLSRPEKAQKNSSTAPEQGQHIYHHHYHHFLSTGESKGENAKVAEPAKELFSTGPLSGQRVEDADTEARRLVRDWTLFCNSKRLDDLVGLYSEEAIILRPNVAPARGRTAIRELLRITLESGLGDVELDSSDTGVLGEIACLTGRSRMLAPVAAGRRQEQTGKYLIVARREFGEWKILADSWSLDTVKEEAASTSISKISPVSTRTARK